MCRTAHSARLSLGESVCHRWHVITPALVLLAALAGCISDASEAALDPQE